MSDIAPLSGYDHYSLRKITRTARAVLPNLLTLASTAERMVDWAERPPGLVDFRSRLPNVTTVISPAPIDASKAEKLRGIARRQVGDGLCVLATESERIAEVVESLAGDYPDVHYAFNELRAAADAIWQIWYGGGPRLIPAELVAMLKSAGAELNKAGEAKPDALSLTRSLKSNGWAPAEEACEDAAATDDATAAESPPPLAPPPPTAPRWNKTSRQLCLGGDVLTKYRRHAGSQFIVLDAFEAAGWPESIRTPKGDYSAKDTVDELKKRLSDTRLQMGMGEDEDGNQVIRWWLTAV
ncbi:MAG TPA: hypothetical protein VFW33_13260 [Gemmataceae bacterium]|nr:hypothetical protein [Gemmataceae bacterium]